MDDKNGLTYAIEVLGINGLPFRLDGHPINTKPGSFGLVGVQSTIAYRFTDQIVGSASVLFTLAGQNDIAAIYPNFQFIITGTAAGRSLRANGTVVFRLPILLQGV